MNHTDCRTSLALEQREDEVLAHLAHCPDCRAFSSALDRLDDLAPSLAVEPPADLADRLLSGLTDDRSAGVVVPLQPTWRRSVRDAMRSGGVRLTAAAAVVALVAAAATVVVTSRPTPSEVVLASARQTAASGTAEIDVTATTQVTLDAPGDARAGMPPQTPDFAAAPPEMHRYLQREWNRSMRRFQRDMRRFFAQADATMRESSSQLDEAMRQMQDSFERAWQQMERGGNRPPPAPPRPPNPPRVPGGSTPPQPPSPPEQVAARLTVKASGTVDFSADALALEGAVGAGASGSREAFRVAARGNVHAYAPSRGGWRRVPGPAGPLGRILLDPHAVVRIAESAAGDVRHVGSTRVDAEVVEHYRFPVDPRLLGAESEGAVQADAFIGGDGRLRQVTLTTTAAGAVGVTARTEATIGFRDYGTAPAPGDVPTTGAPSEPIASPLLYPLGPSAKAALEGAR